MCHFIKTAKPIQEPRKAQKIQQKYLKRYTVHSERFLRKNRKFIGS